MNYDSVVDGRELVTVDASHLVDDPNDPFTKPCPPVRPSEESVTPEDDSVVERRGEFATQGELEDKELYSRLNVINKLHDRIYELESNTRNYLPTLADLVDRLSIAQLKAIFIHHKRDAYNREMHLIMSDIDQILGQMSKQGKNIGAAEVRAILVIMLANRFIWENESATRAGNDRDPPEVRLHRLEATHSINGVRNNAKNELSGFTNERVDYKVDCLAAHLVEKFGNWDIFQ